MDEEFYIAALQVDDSESYDSLEEVTAKAYGYFSKIKGKGPMRFIFKEKSGKINYVDIKW
jgi:hypothetical protein